MDNQLRYKILVNRNRKVISTGLIFFVLLFSVLPVHALPENQPIKRAKINSELEDLLIGYKNGSIAPDKNVEVIIEFRDQSQNKEILEIKSRYEFLTKNYSKKIKDALEKYKLKNSTLPPKFYLSLSQEDKMKISDSAKSIEKLEDAMKSEIKVTLSREILKKQQPFVQLIERLNGSIIKQFETYNILVAKIPIKNIEYLIENNDISGVYLNVEYKNVFQLDHSTYAIDADVLWNDDSTNGPATAYDVAIVDTGVNHSAPLDYYSNGNLRIWIEQSFVPGEDTELTPP